MSKTASLGYTDTQSGGVSVQNFSRAQLNPVDFIAIQKGDQKTVATNKTSPLDQPETIRCQSTDIKDIYAGTSIDPSVYNASRQGTSILVQVNDIVRVTDSVDTAFQVDLPLSAHIVVKVPKSSYITEAHVQAVISRALGLFYNVGTPDTTRIAAMLRGSMTPTGL